MARVTITRHWHDGNGNVGYAEGEWDGRPFTASWATWQPLGALFYDTWLDVTGTQARAIAAALRREGAIPVPTTP